MTPKRKSASSRNPLHFGASSSSDLTPSSIWFRDKDARKDFSENAESFWRTSLTLTYSMSFTVGVGSHCVTFWSHILPCWSRSFTPTCMNSILQYLSFIRVRGMRIVVTLELVSDVLYVPRVEHPDYPECERLRTMSKDEMISSFCKHPSD